MCESEENRFIPAGAGNTTQTAGALPSAPVHPRGRGEHLCARHSVAYARGSSPRARGTPRYAITSPYILRFIPAGAGNTACPSPSILSKTVHPRGRGEHKIAPPPVRRIGGSSPRARGTQQPDGVGGAVPRFIPAGAGNTNPRLLERVHAYGSSPRARGTLYSHKNPDRIMRFIPAGAGNTRVYGVSRTAGAVHPRGRGEHDISVGLIGHEYGSSPRARGTPSR